jgi:hypothetical protein
VLHFYAPPADAPPSSSHALLFEDDGLQAGDDPSRHLLHRFEAGADPQGLRIAATQTGGWALPYAQIRVVLPEGETRPVTLVSGGVPLVR